MSDAIAVQQDPSNMLQLAIEKGADPAFLEKMLELSERYNASQARKAYVLAMTKFKAKVPPVLSKDASVDFTSSKGRTHYKYANLGSIMAIVTPLLSAQELSVGWETNQNDRGEISVTCHVTHAAGHRESVTLSGPPDDSGGKNRIQMIGSTSEYLRRYTVLAALGLATGDMDTDGRPPEPTIPAKEPPPTNEAQIKRLWAIARSKGVDVTNLPAMIAEKFPYVEVDGKRHMTMMTKEDYEKACEWAERGCTENAEEIPMEFDEHGQAKADLPQSPLPAPKVTEIWPDAEFTDITTVEFIHIVNLIPPVKGKSGKDGPWKVVCKRDDDTEYTVDTFSEPMASLSQALGATGELVEIAYDTKVGKFTNRILVGVRQQTL